MKGFMGSKKTDQQATQSTADNPGDAAEAAGLDVKIPIVTAKDQPRKHRVIQFGYTVTVEGEIPDSYRFQYPVSYETSDELFPGVVPAGYSAEVTVDDVTLFLHTRQGVLGPEFQICFNTVDRVLVDWAESIDGQWMETLTVLEEFEQLTEASLEYLDGDPLFLFGIADVSTQKALEKAAHVPMLKCVGTKPNIAEWFCYLNADIVVDKAYTWTVESFAEVELPTPWTSYKGVGSVVCYLNNETDETTWKHPFYDYFAQLLDHCRRASREEHIKLRINRMLWSYEAECATDIGTQQPLISPRGVQQIADILDVDLATEPFLVNVLKTFLKAFSQQYRLEEDLDLQEIAWCVEIVENERTKATIGKDIANDIQKEKDDDVIQPTVHAQIYCIESGKLATIYAPDCGDCFCDEEYTRLYAKGNRKRMDPVNILPCSLCQVYPAKLQCTYTFGNFCHECYARKHVKTLPRFLDLKPVKIDYRAQNPISTSKEPIPPPKVDKSNESDLGAHWHAFYDMRGCKYFYNFATRESMRRPAPNVATGDADDHPTLINLAQSKDGKKLRVYSTKVAVSKSERKTKKA
jgi:hypothetical protein